MQKLNHNCIKFVICFIIKGLCQLALWYVSFQNTMGQLTKLQRDKVFKPQTASASVKTIAKWFKMSGITVLKMVAAHAKHKQTASAKWNIGWKSKANQKW